MLHHINKLLLLFGLIFMVDHSVSAQQFNWAKSWGNVAFDNGHALALDGQYVYSTGYFSGTVDFDPSANSFFLTPAYNINQDVFISKLDSAGNFIWAKNFGGIGSEDVKGIKVDGNHDIVVVGSFNDTTDFDPSANSFELIPNGYNDIYIAKYDSSGDFLWAKSVGGVGQDYAIFLDVDVTGEIYLTGSFADTVDFDPGVNVHYLYAYGAMNSYTLKLNAQGDFVWVNQLFLPNYNYCYGIKLDHKGNLYSTGTFRYTVDFDPGIDTFNLTSAGYDDMYVAKWDTAGHFIWAKGIGGVSYEYSRAVTCDTAGNVIVTGSFLSTIDFNPGTGVFNMTEMGSAGSDVFVLKLDSAGNFQWAKQCGGVGEGFATAICSDLNGNVYFTGHFNGVTDFNPGPGALNFTSAGLSGGDIYLVKLDAQGGFDWAKQIGGNTYDDAFALIADDAENLYYTGYFEGNVDFNPNAGSFPIISNGSHDAFVSKLGGVTSSLSEINKVKQWNISPNPSNGKFVIENTNNFVIRDVSIFTLQGQKVWSSKTNISGPITVQLSIPSGIYFIQIMDEEKNVITKKLIVE